MDPEISELLHDIDTEELDVWDEEILPRKSSEKEIPVPVSQLKEDAKIDTVQHSTTQPKNHDEAKLPKTKKKKGSRTSKTSTPTVTTPSSSGNQQQKAKKSSAKRARFHPEVDSEVVLNSAGDIVRGALEKAVVDSKFNIPIGYGSEVVHLAERILKEATAEKFTDFCCDLLTDVLGTIEAGRGALNSQAGLELIWAAFHKIRTSKELKGKWESILALLGVGGKPIVQNLLHQYVLRTILGDVVIDQCLHNTRAPKESATSTPSSHSDHDMQVLRYIAGFIPFSLINKYKKMKSQQAKEYFTLLKQWQVNDELSTPAPSFLSYSVTWLNLQNRGGLFRVNDDVFRFFFTLEKASKKIMTKSNLKNLNVDIKDMLKKEITACPKVTRMWNNLTSSTQFPTKNLYNVIIQKWTKLRINAFVKAFNMIKRHEKQVSKKGEKSLRKELSK